MASVTLRSASAFLLVLPTALLAACAPPPASDDTDAGDALAAYLEGREVVVQALDGIGGRDAIGRAGGLTLEGDGRWDLGVRLQGTQPFVPEPQPLAERLVLRPDPARTIYETRSPINPDAEEWLRYDFRGDVTYIVDLLARRAFAAGEGMRPRIERMVPHILLAQVLDQPASLRSAGRDATHRFVHWTTDDGPTLTLAFDAATRRLRAVSYVADMPLRGDTHVRWQFHEYEAVAGLGDYPGGYTIEVDGQPVREIRYTRIATGTAPDLLDAPDGIVYPQPSPPAASSPAPPPNPEEEFAVRELDPGVYLLPNVRGGFHVLFVEFADFVLAVDAPAGWLELQEIPARIGGGRASTAVGERYLRAIRSRIPDKPVRYVALTHHHDDHAGGVRPFLDAGATILASLVTRRVVEEAVTGSHTLAGAPADSSSTPIRFEAVVDTHTISDADMEVRLIDVGPNPHADGMLAVHLPRQRILYVADLFEPSGEAFFPSPARVPVMRWFVDWLDRSGLEPERIYAIHGTALVTDAQLAQIRALDTGPR